MIKNVTPKKQKTIAKTVDRLMTIIQILRGGHSKYTWVSAQDIDKAMEDGKKLKRMLRSTFTMKDPEYI